MNEILGFLSPEGKFHKCEYFYHHALADELLWDLYREKSNIPEGRLCEHGWVIIQSSFIGFTNSRHMIVRPTLTKEQREWLENNTHRLHYEQRSALEDFFEIENMYKEEI